MVSPMGDLMWAKVLTPGIQNAGKASEKEAYSIELLMPKGDPEAEAFVKKLKGLFIAEHGNASRPGQNGLPCKTYLNEKGEETGLWKFSFNRNTTTKRGTELPPPVVQDAKGQPWPKDHLIGNGSTGKVAFTYYAWDSPEGGKGISLQLEAVRVITFVEYAPPNHAAAFGDAEEGYELPFQPAGDDPFGGESSEEDIPF
jgi:hypothetical protein